MFVLKLGSWYYFDHSHNKLHKFSDFVNFASDNKGKLTCGWTNDLSKATMYHDKDQLEKIVQHWHNAKRVWSPYFSFSNEHGSIPNVLSDFKVMEILLRAVDIEEHKTK